MSAQKVMCPVGDITIIGWSHTTYLPIVLLPSFQRSLVETVEGKSFRERAKHMIPYHKGWHYSHFLRFGRPKLKEVIVYGQLSLF